MLIYVLMMLNKTPKMGEIKYMPIGEQRARYERKAQRKAEKTAKRAEFYKAREESPPNRKVAKALLASLVAIGSAAAVANEGRVNAEQKPAKIVREHLAPNISIENPYEVKAGDTYWGIAEQLVGEKGDPRPVVDALKSANGNAELHPGDSVRIPGVPTSE